MPDGSYSIEKTPLAGRFSMAQPACWAGAACLLLAWLNAQHFPPWVSWHSEALAFGAVLILSWHGLVQAWRSGTPFLRVPRPVLAFSILGAAAVVQLAAGILTFQGDLIVFWLYLALCVASLTLGYGAATRADSDHTQGHWTPVQQLALIFVLGSIASVVVGLAQVLDLWPESNWIARMPEVRRPGANLGQPNQFALLVVTGIASLAFLYLSGRCHRLIAALALLVLCAGLASSESRSGALSLMALAGWWQLKRPAFGRRTSVWVAPVAALVYVAMFLAWPWLLNVMDLDRDATNRFTYGDLRMAMWLQLLEAVLQRPWFGWGVLEVSEALNGVAHAHPTNNPFTYSHNLLLDLAVWFGVPLALGLVTVTAVWIVRAIGKVQDPPSWYCLAAALPLIVHSMLEFPYAYAYFLAPVMFLLGFFERAGARPPAFRIRPVAACVVLGALSATLFWSVIEYLRIEEDFRIVRFEQLRIGQTPQAHHRPDVVLFSQLEMLLSGSRIELRPDMPPNELEQLRKLALRYPWVATQYRYSFALALNGQQEEAIRQLQVLRWQRGERLYGAVKAEMRRMADERYPQLRTMIIP